MVDNRLSGNRLSGNRLSGNRLSGNRLSGNRLSGNRLELSAAGADLVETADGREVLTYMISCAVPEGTTIVGTDSHGITYEFFGEIGLAPHWLDHAMTETDKRWVSACLFSRVNAHDVAVAVSLRGPNPALATTPEEMTDWSIEEGAFYGQYFLPLSEPIAWFACSGRHSAAALAEERDCSQPDPLHPGLTLCGFNYTGDCGDYAPPASLMACESQSSTGTYYRSCADRPAFLNHHHMHGIHDIHGDGDDDHGHDGHDDDHHDHHGDDHHGHHDHEPMVFEQVITTFVHP